MIFNVAIVLAIIISSTNGGLTESDPAFLLECRIPRDSAASLNNQSIVDAESGLLSQKDMEQLELEGRCFLGCVTERYSDQVNRPIIIEIKLMMFDSFMIFSDPSLSS